MNTLKKIGFSDNEQIAILGSSYCDAVAVIISLIPEMADVYVYITDDIDEIKELEYFNRVGIKNLSAASPEAIERRLDYITKRKFSKAWNRSLLIWKNCPK